MSNDPRDHDLAGLVMGEAIRTMDQLRHELSRQHAVFLVDQARPARCLPHTWFRKAAFYDVATWVKDEKLYLARRAAHR